MKKKIIGRLLIFIFVSNVPPIKLVFTFFDHDDYKFSNIDGWFTFKELQFKGRKFEQALAGFEYFKQQCNCTDTTLYRLNKNNPFKFWRYGDYIFKKKYQLPYKSWNEIEKNRSKSQKHTIEYTDY